MREQRGGGGEWEQRRDGEADGGVDDASGRRRGGGGARACARRQRGAGVRGDGSERDRRERAKVLSRLALYALSELLAWGLSWLRAAAGM